MQVPDSTTVPPVRVRSALNPVFGPRRIARFFAGIVNKAKSADVAVRLAIVDVNGEPAVSMTIGDGADVMVCEFGGSGAVRGIRRVSNPTKLSRAFGARGA